MKPILSVSRTCSPARIGETTDAYKWENPGLCMAVTLQSHSRGSLLLVVTRHSERKMEDDPLVERKVSLWMNTGTFLYGIIF